MRKVFLHTGPILLCAALFFGVIHFAHAEAYTLLEKSIPVNPNADFGTFMTEAYKWIFRLAGLIAVLSLIYGGVKYVFGGFGGSMESNVTEAKDIFRAVAVGGALLLLSYLILYTINPQLVDFGFNFDRFPATYE